MLDDLLSGEPWPVVLLALRLGVVAALYLFLVAAFKTLYAELRSPRVGEAREARPREAPSPVAASAPPEPVETEPALEPVPVEALPRPVLGRAWLQRRWLIVGVMLVVVLGSAGAMAAAWPNIDRALDSGDASTGVPTRDPGAGRVTVGLAATEDSSLRVTVDGVVQFNGILEAGERQLWEGSERVQVWTDKGRTMLLSVNGQELGPYSPAMGHPDWNRIDFGFWPGWSQ